jgi:plastocyanin
MRRGRLPVAIVVVSALLAAPAHAANQTVTVGSGCANTFTQAAVTVLLGESVTWNNQCGFHNVHFDDGSFVQPSPPQSAPWTVSRTFTNTGTFRYYCEVHGGPNGTGMSGTVTVNPSGFPRPRGATPLRASLVVAYKPCNSANRTHGAPLSSGSCNPPVQESSFLTVGTGDANPGTTPNSVGSVRFDAKTTTPEDIAINSNVTDVRNQSGLTDYAGQLEAKPVIRITDKNNSADPATKPFDEAGTTTDTPFSITLPCATTLDTGIGSTCSVSTSANAVLAGSVGDAKRTIWQLGQVQVFDGGSDGVASTSGNTLFMDEGFFVP